MKTEYGIWEISTGRNDRVYIKCTDPSQVMHSESLCGTSGLGIYGYSNLKDLGVAILKFEKERNAKNSILSKV